MRIANVHPSSADGLPADERERRERRWNGYAMPDTIIDEYYISGANIFDRPFGSDGHVGTVVERIVERIEDAAATRPDVILVTGGIEPGVSAARNKIKDIPIVSTGQSTYAVAMMLGSQLGYRVGLIVYEESIIEPMRGVARANHAEWMIADVRSIDVPLPQLYPRRAEVRERIIAVAKSLVADGATIIFPQGLSMVPSTMSAEELSREIGGVPVLDGLRISILVAELLGKLAPLTQAASVTAL
jgi:Asp/Glu/hydantoin racemase